MDMFRIGNAAVGNNFNQIMFFLSSSSPLHFTVAQELSFCFTRFKTTAAQRHVYVTSCLRVSVASLLPPLFIPEVGSEMLLHLSKQRALGLSL